MPYREQAAEVLARWRAAERAFEAAMQGSAEQAAIQVDIDTLRIEYNRLVNLQRGAMGPPLSEEPAPDRP
jgi:hypothetical protein